MNVQHPDIVVRYIKTKTKKRKIVAYRSDDCALREYHQQVNNFLQERFIPSIFAKGYIKGRSIYHNALAHMYNDYFIMLDIKDFFPHICHKQLEDRMLYEINLKTPDQINRKECKKVIKNCSVSNRGLPLGFITSPILSNIYLKEFDGIFYGNLKNIGLDNLIYTRYADDIVVSFKCEETIDNDDVKDLIISIATKLLSKYGLQLNNKKTRSYDLNISNHVRITGINIIKEKTDRRKLTIGRSIKNQLFWDAVKCYKTKDISEVQKIKGIQSFILSVEKTGYEDCYSKAMMEVVNSLGFDTLKELIESL